MNTPDGYISVCHGKLTVNVPRNIFKGCGTSIDEEKLAPFRTLLRERYPWLTDNSIDVLMRTAQKEMIRTVDEETSGRTMSMKLASEGRIEDAIRHMEKNLEKDSTNADSWYALGELLCKAGRPEEGFKAFAKGRELF